MRTQAEWISKNEQHFDITQVDELTLLFKPLGGLNADSQGIYVTGAISDLRGDVIAIQTDATLDPGAAPATGDRYILENAAVLHANFGTITGVGDDDIVEYDGVDFIVTYDASADENNNALAWVTSSEEWQHYDGTGWHIHQGLSTLVAGNGLVIAGGQIDLVPDNTSGGDIAPINVVSNGVGVDVNELNGDHLNIDWNPTNYTPDSTIAEADNDDDLSAHLKGIDDLLGDINATHLEQTVTQAGHGFSINQVIRLNSGAWALAQANNAANAEAIGVVNDVINTNEFVVVTHGVCTNLSGLTADTVYFLDATTAGALAAVPPTTVGHVAKAVLYAKTTTEAYVYDRIGVEVAAADPVAYKEHHVITAAEVTSGFFTLNNVPALASLVEATVVGGPEQVNFDGIGRSATADFRILGGGNDEFHFNNNGLATGLSEDMAEGHEIMITYTY